MSGEGIKVPRREGATGESGDPKGPESLGSPAPAAAKEFFLIEYVKEVMRGLRWLRSSPKPEHSTLNRVQKGLFRWSKGSKSRIGVVAVLGIIMVAFMLLSAQAASTPLLCKPGEPGCNIGPVGPGPGPGPNSYTIPLSGNVAENSESEHTITLNATALASMTVILSWTDDTPSNPTVRQTPDNLGLTIMAPDGQTWELPAVSNGRVSWSLAENETGKDWGGADWMVHVVGGTMGDEVPITNRPGICLRCQADTSNDYDVSVQFSW